MAEMQKLTYPSADGIHQIHGRLWLPEGEPRGVVQLVHGVAEHMGRYEATAQYLTGLGYAVCGEDHLGHGETADDGVYGFFAPDGGWDMVVEDTASLRRRMGDRFPGLPYFLLGHSMGSFLVRTYLIRYPGTVTAAVLSGTGQPAAPLVLFGRALAGLLAGFRGPNYVSNLVYRCSLGGYNKAFRPNRTSADWISRDEAVVDAYLADPLCTFRPTVGMFRDMLRALHFIGMRENAVAMDPDTPIYFFSGDHDPVGDMGRGVEKVERLFRIAGCRDVTVRLYPGGRHEMLNEVNRDEVLADLGKWLASRENPQPGV